MSIEPQTHEPTIITREDARSSGSKRYFTGLLCVNGHLSERQVSSGNCLACSAARKRSSREKDPEGHREKFIAWTLENRDKINEQRRARHRISPERHRKESINQYYKNRDKILEQKRAHRLINREELNRKQRERTASNPEYGRYLAKLRRAAEIQAVPPWFSELDEFVWQEATHLTALRFVATGIKWAADHMIPLRAKTASGLHVWNNCQVIPDKLNNKKKNRLELTEHLEWLKLI